MKPKRIAFLIYPAIQALDIAGPMDAFAAARVARNPEGSIPGYELITIGLTRKSVAAECGLILKPQFTIHTTPAFDTLVIPGGAGMRDPQIGDAVGGWLHGLPGRPRRIAAVCTGVFGLAASGLLGGRRVTTHWRYSRELATRFPSLRIDNAALFLRDGRYYTSAGITAGIDLSLALIEEDYGPGVALAVARELVVYVKREGGQEQYSEALQYQTRTADEFSDLISWISANLHKPLTVETLAARVNFSPRHFARRFKFLLGRPPADFIEMARLEESRRRLAGDHRSIDDIARSLGYQSDDVFRRAFERRFGISPSTYRLRFGHGTPESSPARRMRSEIGRNPTSDRSTNPAKNHGAQQ